MAIDPRTYELILQMQKDIETLKSAVVTLSSEVSNAPTQSDITSVQTEFRENLQTLGTLVVRLEKKLELWNLPEDTRYYLDANEITKLREAVEENKKVLVEIMKMRQSVTSLMSRFDLAN